MLAVDPHEVCRGAGKASKGNTGIVLTSSAALALTFSAGGTPIVNNGIVLTSGTAVALAFSAGAVLALVQNVTRLGVVF